VLTAGAAAASGPRRLSTLRRGFLKYINGHLSCDKARALVEDSLECAQKIFSLAGNLQSPVALDKHPAPAQAQARLLKAVLALRLRKNPEQDWAIDKTVTAELMMDYLFLRDLMSASYFSMLQRLTRRHGQNFLTESEQTDYERIRRENPSTAEDYLGKTAGPGLAGLWYFTMALCRRLMIRENSVTATDAYWLGLVDEVMGTELTWRPIEGESRRGC